MKPSATDRALSDPRIPKQIGLIVSPSEKADLEIFSTCVAKVVGSFLPGSRFHLSCGVKSSPVEVPPARYTRVVGIAQQYQGSPAGCAHRKRLRSARIPRAGEHAIPRYFLAHILQFQFHRALCKEQLH